MKRLGALMVVVPLGALIILAAANLWRIHQDESYRFDPLKVGGVYGFHPGAPVRAHQVTKDPWSAPSAARLAASRGKQMTLGVETQSGPFDLWRVAYFQHSVHRDVDFVQYSRSWALPFQGWLAQDVWRRGAIPLLTWEPWTYAAGVNGFSGAVVNQPRYSLKTIIAGKHDRYIKAYARAIRHFGHPLLLRFGPEMNGNWNSWSTGVNGNKPGQFVAAWRHIYRLFAKEHATNVIWVWAPNVTYPGGKPIKDFYPGDKYVDVIGFDGYNWGHLHPWSRWQTFSSIFGLSLRQAQQLAPWKPVLITETASTEVGGNKAVWIRDLVQSLKRYPQIIGFNWFNRLKETDWRVQSSPEATQAFAAADKSFPSSPAAQRFRQRLWKIDRSLNPPPASTGAKGAARSGS